MLVILLLSLTIYSFFQIRYYVKYGYKKEIIIFLVLMGISILYLVGQLLKIKIPKVEDLLALFYKPISELLYRPH